MPGALDQASASAPGGIATLTGRGQRAGSVPCSARCARSNYPKSAGTQREPQMFKLKCEIKGIPGHNGQFDAE